MVVKNEFAPIVKPIDGEIKVKRISDGNYCLESAMGRIFGSVIEQLIGTHGIANGV